MSAAPRTRADAVRNYERVLSAASEVLAEKGAEAGVPEIAARAGVGKGTVYRCFPTKEHLVAAVATERARWFERQARAAAADPDPWRAFAEFMASVAEEHRRDQIARIALVVHDQDPCARQHGASLAERRFLTQRRRQHRGRRCRAHRGGYPPRGKTDGENRAGSGLAGTSGEPGI